jgi:SAM-dependent methyltransferase
METRVIEKIAGINQEFYQRFARSFAVTRYRIQPGVARLLEEVPKTGNWLDIGCGNGTLALARMEKGCEGRYLGCDLSPVLIEEAEKKLEHVRKPAGLSIDFQVLDVNQHDWYTALPGIKWDWISLFAVFHHIPSSLARQKLCKQLRALLPSGKQMFISVWQLQNSPRLRGRIKPWHLVGLQPREVEEGDVLMDWRAHVSGDEPSSALRYVHIFSEEELRLLADGAGFHVSESFYSDGKEGNLALYQTWD